jgi:hypothetical protein
MPLTVTVSTTAECLRTECNILGDDDDDNNNNNNNNKRMCNTYCFFTATVSARTRLNVTLLVLLNVHSGAINLNLWVLTNTAAFQNKIPFSEPIFKRI